MLLVAWMMEVRTLPGAGRAFKRCDARAQLVGHGTVALGAPALRGEQGDGLARTGDLGQAYVLADISTFLAYNLKSDLNIEPIVDKDSIFLNVYAAIAINPETHPNAKIDIANQFINWLISDEVQDIIGTYGTAEYGRSLFFPIASCDMLGCPPEEDYTTPVPPYNK